jgi:hypothetical protein
VLQLQGLLWQWRRRQGLLLQASNQREVLARRIDGASSAAMAARVWVKIHTG